MSLVVVCFVDKRNPMKGVDVGNPNLNLSFFLLKTFLSYIQSIFFLYLTLLQFSPKA